MSLRYLFLIFIDFVFLLVGALDWGEETSEMETIPRWRIIRSHGLAIGQEFRPVIPEPQGEAGNPGLKKLTYIIFTFKISFSALNFSYVILIS